MTLWHSGRQTEYIEDILAARKTIEIRLKRGKFAQYRPGEYVILREDRTDKPALPNRVVVQIVGIREYPSFQALLEQEGYKKIIPRANSPKEALKVPRQFYTEAEEAEYGAVAIEFRLADRSEIESQA